MLVRELIEHLKQCPPGTPVMAKDVFGKPSSYIVLYFSPDGVCIDTVPEPDTRYCDHPFDDPDDDRYCPGPCNGDFNE